MVFFALLFLAYASLNSILLPTPSLEGRGGIHSGDPEREFRKGRGWIRGNRPACQAFYDLDLGRDSVSTITHGNICGQSLARRVMH